LALALSQAREASWARSEAARTTADRSDQARALGRRGDRRAGRRSHSSAETPRLVV